MGVATHAPLWITSNPQRPTCNRFKCYSKKRWNMSELTYEYCCDCGCETGKAGRGEDSIYCDLCDSGPFCEECFDKHRCTQELQKELTAARAEADALKKENAALKWFIEKYCSIESITRRRFGMSHELEWRIAWPRIVAAYTKHTAREGEEE